MDTVDHDVDRGSPGDSTGMYPSIMNQEALPEEEEKMDEMKITSPQISERHQTVKDLSVEEEEEEDANAEVEEDPPGRSGDDHIENPLTTINIDATNGATQPQRPQPLSPSPSTNHSNVSECATTYSIIMACITTSYTAFDSALFAYDAYSTDEKVYKFWGVIILPMSTTAMAISFALKPRRNGWKYKTLLLLQYALFTFVPEFLAIVGDDFATRQVIMSSGRSLFYLAFLKVGMMSRSHMANLSDEDLSKFLTNDVIMGGVLMGLGQLAFLMFGSVQCDGNAGNWRKCNRTLVSQTSLSAMVTLLTIIKILSGVVPKRILDNHVISPKKVFAMDLNTEQAVQAFGLLIAAGCALYPLGNYGAEGDFRSQSERYASYIVPSIGGFCLVLTAVWKMVVIRGEMRLEAEAEETGQLHQGSSSSPSSPSSDVVTLVEGSPFWFYGGVMATTYQSAVTVAVAVTMDEFFYKTLSTVSLPIVILIYIGSIFDLPRRMSPKDMWKLRLHFISFAFISEMAWAMYEFRQGNFSGVILHFARLTAEALVFHLGLKLRAAVGRLPDEDLETFLVDTIFKGGLQTLFSILFLTFRTTKCMFEEGSVAECSNASWCSTMISLYLILWWGMKLVQGSVRSEVRTS
ncbi:hypothetical protein TrVE_jg12803 [Triparma verrucosa]|uniref:Uncharacterized protein n=1 Tax=Triparma verrucosa TaxID=1606542 RepID=A0A9W7CGP2_9STRA|nr:hypothetical protein TrVE_jg12803 [Triparma verrucosa]